MKTKKLRKNEALKKGRKYLEIATNEVWEIVTESNGFGLSVRSNNASALTEVELWLSEAILDGGFLRVI